MMRAKTYKNDLSKRQESIRENMKMMRRQQAAGVSVRVSRGYGHVDFGPRIEKDVWQHFMSLSVEIIGESIHSYRGMPRLVGSTTSNHEEKR